MTVRLPRPSDWPKVLAYGLEARAGWAFMGGPPLVSSGSGTHPLPLELVPALAEVDLGSDEAVLEFVRAVGVLGAWQDGFRIMDRLGGHPAARTAPFDLRWTKRQTGIDVPALIQARRDHAAWGADPSGEFVDEFRIAAGGLLGLFAIVRELEARAFSPKRLAKTWPRFCPWRAPEDRAAAWADLTLSVNEALAAVSLALGWVRAEGIDTDVASRDWRPGPPDAVVVAPPRSLYAVCVVELADHILSGHRYRVCANETCGRLFTIQEGRSRYGGHRTDTLRFHNVRCKDAQAAREYRRRKAAKEA